MSVFNRSKRKRIETSVHNLSHNFAGTFYPGYLYPVLCTKVVPGDTFQIASSPFLRSQPFVSPLMSNVFCDIRYFYCRNLLLWENFDKYITNAEKYGVGYLQPGYVPVHPYLNFSGDEFPGVDSYPYKAFFDNLYGAVDISEDGVAFRGLDSLPARMYNLIYNEYYMNENYCKPATIYHGDYSDAEGAGGNVFQHYRLLKGCYRKDYFTSMLPSPQRGPAVSIDAAISGKLGNLVDVSGRPLELEGGSSYYDLYAVPEGDRTRIQANNPGSTPVQSGKPGYLEYDGLDVMIDINDIRKASAIQRFLETSAVNGNRYAEFMLAHFGVRTPDNSSFRPQYLGGGSQVINYSPVEQNSQTDNTPQGTLAGKGVMSGLMGMNHRYFFTEYGWIMAIMVIRPQAYYAGGVNRQMWCDQDRFENYYFPGLQNIGMQSVKFRELSVSLTEEQNNADIGYQDRYMEYKNIPSSVHGELLNSMKSWVAIRDFTYDNTGGDIGIGQEFMEVQPDVFDENTAVQRFPPFIVDIRHDVLARRPMQYHAKYGGAV